jgi:dihydroorotase
MWMGTQEASCGCAGVFSAPIALQIYAQLFEDAGKLDNLEPFCSFHGADFYGLPRNTGAVKLVREPCTVPDFYPYGNSEVVPFLAGQDLRWSLV